MSVSVKDTLQEVDVSIAAQVLKGDKPMLDRRVLVTVGAPGKRPSMATGRLEEILDLVVEAWESQTAIATAEAAQVLAEVEVGEGEGNGDEEDAGDEAFSYDDF